jgi:tRNA nucleotidyltransferase (CCA-adding enzyme)
MKLILTHENADFDAVASMLGASKLYPDATPILPKTMNRAVQEFLMLYKNALPFIHHKDWKLKRNKIEQAILTDTQTYQSVKGIKQHTPILIIDHHPLERDLKENETWDGHVLGAISTLLVERVQKQKIAINSLEATLLALGIYADTGMLTYSSTTHRDASAVAWLIKQGAVLTTIRRFLTLPLTDTQQTIFDKLLKTASHRRIHGHSVTIASTKVNEYVGGISSVTQRLMDIWDSGAIFTLVAMPQKTQLVCRSRVDDIDVSTVAELFGGGGHPKASASTIKGYEISSIGDQIWNYLQLNIRPAMQVANLMSQGLQVLDANDLVAEKLSFIRQVGHEGYPVVEDNRIVGLLTRRDADRASEHKLDTLQIRDIMIEGNITLTPNDSVSSLEQLIVNSGWGQIPIVNSDGEPIGIVTRTDLIKHWAMTHPSYQAETPAITPDDTITILGTPVAQLIEVITQHAQVNDISIYMVGGVVRDLLLKRKNLDIDFVVEGDAISFAETLAQKFEGTIHSHKPFGTATWILDETVAQILELSLDAIPHHIDFATARFEYYEQPTALPTVYSSSVKLDLQRRDFTMNTLAIQLSPQQQMWRILDFYGGIHDLNEGLIRVLHSLSFVDDPTRILRAVRFSERLKFVIDPRTAQLIQGALPMLKRITGERIQNEITLILRENTPERGILKLQALGVLEAIHPDFQVSVNTLDYFELCRTHQLPWDTAEEELTRLYWHIMMVGIPSKSVEQICNRFLLGRGLTESMVATTSLLEDMTKFAHPSIKPSQITKFLEKMPEISLQVVWIASNEQAPVRQSIEQFMTIWRHQRTTINGNDLKQMGLPPGPQYKVILERLRFAWLDGDITTPDEEQDLLHQLIQGNH